MRSEVSPFRQGGKVGISAASNTDSIKVQTKLSRTNAALSKTYERLSSGLRINSASDDPAGLALADSLRADSRIANVAIRNANDGLSIAAIADSGLEEIGNMLSRMSELAQQSSNGVYTTSQRSALSSEFVALSSEIDRIAKTTTFNGRALLSNSSNISLQVGFNSNATSQITLVAVAGTLAALGLSSGPDASILTYSINDTSSGGAQAAALTALSAVSNAITSLSVIRGTVGAAESRLGSAVSYLQVARENLVAAESNIRDVDTAKEVAELVRLQVLRDASAAVLAQANQTPRLVLTLLG